MKNFYLILLLTFVANAPKKDNVAQSTFEPFTELEAAEETIRMDNLSRSNPAANMGDHSAAEDVEDIEDIPGFVHQPPRREDSVGSNDSTSGQVVITAWQSNSDEDDSDNASQAPSVASSEVVLSVIEEKSLFNIAFKKASDFLYTRDAISYIMTGCSFRAAVSDELDENNAKMLTALSWSIFGFGVTSLAYQMFAIWNMQHLQIIDSYKLRFDEMFKKFNSDFLQWGFGSFLTILIWRLQGFNPDFVDITTLMVLIMGGLYLMKYYTFGEIDQLETIQTQINETSDFESEIAKITNEKQLFDDALAKLNSGDDAEIDDQVKIFLAHQDSNESTKERVKNHINTLEQKLTQLGLDKNRKEKLENIEKYLIERKTLEDRFSEIDDELSRI